MILSIDESIQRLKAEIIAQDWSLSQKRITLLEASFACLKQRFKSRKAAFAILTMAGSVLDYIKRRGENSPTVTIDFLKESMAHIVNLYEDDNFNPEQEEKLFRGLYGRFSTLKQQINKDRSETPAAAPQAPAANTPKEEPPLSPSSISQLENKITALRRESANAGLHKENIVQLIQDLQSSLEQAEDVGAAIRELLDDLLGLKESNAGMEPDLPPQQAAQGKTATTVRQEIKICPVTELRGLTIGNSHVYIRESAIAMIRDLGEKKKKEYLHTCNVPLKDFCGFMKGLARQFTGPLAKIPDKKLKKLTLPIMVPIGLDLPEIADESATKLLVVSNGQWNGVLICSGIDNETKNMIKFKKAINGDFAGMGYGAENEKLSLLNIVSLLRREGFMTMV